MENKRSLPLDTIRSPFDDLLVRGLNRDPAERITDIIFRDLMWQGLRANVVAISQFLVHKPNMI